MQTITAGSAISVTVTQYDSTLDEGKGQQDILKQLVSLQANGQATDQQYIKIGGQDAIKAVHNSGENRNTHSVIIFTKGNEQFTIDQQYKLGTSNPDSAVLDGIVATFTFSS